MLVFVVPSLGKGGAQRATISLANALAEEGKKIQILALKTDDEEFSVSEGISVHRMDCHSFSRSLVPLAKALVKSPPDLVYSCLWHVNLLVTLARVLCLFRGLRFTHIASIHNNPARIMETENYWLSRLYYYFIARFATWIIVVSQGIKDQLSRNILIPEDQIHVIPNISITSDHKLALEKDLKHDFVEKHREGYLIWVGRLDFQKNVTLFLDVVEAVRMPALVIGEGPEEEIVIDRIRRLNDSGVDACYLEFQPNVMYFMKNAKCLLLTSRFEGFGLVLVEALYCGTPVISTNCEYGPSDIVKHGHNGYLVGDNVAEFASAFSELIERSQQLSTNARPSVLEYETPAVLQKFTDMEIF
ncbi:MAG: glycosyltransferase [Pseudomonadales bacterium]|nr:glycosyltransferase [Pseudomonadales bacterium]